MSELSLISLASASSSIGSRSLWQDARLRLSHNRPAMISCYILLILSLLGLFGPMISPHPYNKVYPQFVHVPPSLAPYPDAANIFPDLERTLAQARLVAIHNEPVQSETMLSIMVRNQNGRPLDQRVLRYFNRSDLYRYAELEIEPNGLSGTLSLRVSQNYFLFGTDNIGRDLLSRILIGIAFHWQSAYWLRSCRCCSALFMEPLPVIAVAGSIIL